MALATRLAAKSDSGSCLIKYNGGAMQYGTAYTNGTDIFLTAGITFQNESNEEDCDLVAAGERVDGIVIGEAFPAKVDMSKDSDSTFANNKAIRYYKPISGDMLYATVLTATTITQDEYVKYSGGFITTSSRANANAVAREAVTAVSATEAIIAIEWVIT